MISHRTKETKMTIVDVARNAGVSIATVSRFINGQYHYMSEATREWMQSVIHEIGYIPKFTGTGFKKTKNSGNWRAHQTSGVRFGQRF